MTEMEDKKSGGKSIIVIVVGIILAAMVLGTILLAGVTFLWSESFVDEVTPRIETMNLIGSIDSSENLLHFYVISGTYDWEDHRVLVDETVLTLTSGPIISCCGQNATFTGGTYTAGMVYPVYIVEIAGDRLRWQDDIMAMERTKGT